MLLMVAVDTRARFLVRDLSSSVGANRAGLGDFAHDVDAKILPDREY